MFYAHFWTNLPGKVVWVPEDPVKERNLKLYYITQKCSRGFRSTDKKCFHHLETLTKTFFWVNFEKYSETKNDFTPNILQTTISESRSSESESQTIIIFDILTDSVTSTLFTKKTSDCMLTTKFWRHYSEIPLNFWTEKSLFLNLLRS